MKIPSVEVDFPAVLERAKGILIQSRIALRQGLETEDNLKLLRGHARFEGRDGKIFRVRVGTEMITARQVVLDTGTRSQISPIEGLNDIDFLHAGNWLEKPELPEHLAVIGASYTGLEMGQFYRRMGSRVTINDESGQNSIWIPSARWSAAFRRPRPRRRTTGCRIWIARSVYRPPTPTMHG